MHIPVTDVGVAERVPAFAGESRDLLLKIAAAVQRESLQSLLQALEGARLQGETVVLEAGSANEFYRRQVRESLALIGQAASRVIGREVKVRLHEGVVGENSEKAGGTNPADANVPVIDVLERAKRDPVVQSFLDTFPGPVKAEKIDT